VAASIASASIREDVQSVTKVKVRGTTTRCQDDNEMHASSRRLRKFTFYDLNLLDKTPQSLAMWLDEKTSAAAIGLSTQTSDFSSAFPLIVLSYADLIDLPESISHVLSLRGDAVCVFTPHFCMGN
jgi:hypothetical protein